MLLLAAGIALTGCGGTHHGAEAEAAVTPKMQTQQAGSWSSMARRPTSIVLGGNLWPQAYRLRWSRWTSKNGKATGKVGLFLGCKPPSYKCRTTDRNVTVWVNTRRTRKGLSYPFFTRMTYRYNNAKKGASKVRLVNRHYRLAWTTRGAFWHGPSCSSRTGVC